MKKIKKPQIVALMIGSLSLVSCATYNPFESISSGYNPLDPAGSVTPQEEVEAEPSTSYSAGSFLTTQSSGTALFARFPSQSDQPIRTLAVDTDVKVISSKVSYTKIEVVNTGEVGFVPTVMLGEKRSVSQVSSIPDVPTIDMMPSLLPEGESVNDSEVIPSSFSVVEDLPFVAPEPENKGIKPPEIVDPLLPAE